MCKLKQTSVCTCAHMHTHKHTCMYTITCLQQNQKGSEKSIPYTLQSYQVQHIFNIFFIFLSFCNICSYFSSSVVHQRAQHSMAGIPFFSKSDRTACSHNTRGITVTHSRSSIAHYCRRTGDGSTFCGCSAANIAPIHRT